MMILLKADAALISSNDPQMTRTIDIWQDILEIFHF